MEIATFVISIINLLCLLGLIGAVSDLNGKKERKGSFLDDVQPSEIGFHPNKGGEEGRLEEANHSSQARH